MQIAFVYEDRHRWAFLPVKEEAATPTEENGRTLAWFTQAQARYREAVARAEAGGRDWLSQAISWMRRGVDPSEPLLYALRTTPQIEILFTPQAGPRRTRRYLRRFLTGRLAAHRLGLLLNVALLPLTALLTPLPGPNVFFFWNAYRLLAHLLCGSGASRALRQFPQILYTPQAENPQA
jgi:hypothetical protein